MKNGLTRQDLSELDELLSHFPHFFKRSVGYDRMIDTMRKGNTTSNTYPPYNIIQKNDDDYVIEMAVVGFERDNISIEVDKGVLKINGSNPPKDEGFEYIHKGLANRDFKHTFQLGDHIIVGNAVLKDGLLTVELNRELPEALKPRLIEIR